MMPTLFARATLALLLLFILAPIAADAAESPAITVSLPWGNWTADIIAYIGTLLVGTIVYFVKRYVPAPFSLFITNDMISRAVNTALLKAEGAAVGKTLTFPVFNSVVASAINEAFAAAPNLAKKLGAELRPRIQAELSKLGCAPVEAVK